MIVSPTIGIVSEDYQLLDNIGPGLFYFSQWPSEVDMNFMLQMTTEVQRLNNLTKVSELSSAEQYLNDDCKNPHEFLSPSCFFYLS